MSSGSCLYELRRLSFQELWKLIKKLRQLVLGAKAAAFGAQATVLIGAQATALKAKTAGLGSRKGSSGFRLYRASVLYTTALRADVFDPIRIGSAL
jgi:hypothetical protein